MKSCILDTKKAGSLQKKQYRANVLGYWCLIQRLTLYVIQQPSGLYNGVLAIGDHAHCGSVLIPIAPLSRSASRCTSEGSRACTSPFHAFSIASTFRFVKPKRNVYEKFIICSLSFLACFSGITRRHRPHTQMTRYASWAGILSRSECQLQRPGPRQR